ncbi:MAG: hypothetical protein A3C84_02000, partial [Candidatus Ryanbacteria bacterium RIFCSPHIGHO2_02_FULL_48_12]
WVPIALSLVMLAFILVYIATFGIAAPNPDADEGTPAHLFQIWMVLEVCIMGSFAITWLPQAPRQALCVLALQVGAASVPIAIIFILEL